VPREASGGCQLTAIAFPHRPQASYPACCDQPLHFQGGPLAWSEPGSNGSVPSVSPIFAPLQGNPSICHALLAREDSVLQDSTESVPSPSSSRHVTSRPSWSERSNGCHVHHTLNILHGVLVRAHGNSPNYLKSRGSEFTVYPNLGASYRVP